MNKKSFPVFLAAVFVLAAWLAPAARAQWLTQSVGLQPGWNAVYLFVDASYATLDSQVAADPGNPIQEIWLWNPSPSTAQFVTNPQLPTGGDSQWSSWLRPSSTVSELQSLVPNAAYLVRVGGSAPYTWKIKGKPVAPSYHWTTTGLNLLGFPTPASSPPLFDNFLAPAVLLEQTAEIYHYTGGDLSASNPSRLFALTTTPLRRGEAFWMRAGDMFNQYFGPFSVNVGSSTGVNFNSTLSQYELRVRNMTDSALTVSMQLVASETAPTNQPPLVGTIPVLVRGALNPTNLTYGYSNLSAGVQSWTLQPQGQPGAEVLIVLGVDRSQMSGNAGDLFAGVIRLTDSLGLSEVNLSAVATVASSAGLWVGSASLSQVRNYLKTYDTNLDGSPKLSDSGAYTVTSVNTNLGSVSLPYPLRIILHNDSTGRVVLLQRVYHGIGLATNEVVATQERLLLKNQLASARRISSVHFPWSVSNTPWPMSGALQQGTNLTVTVPLSFDDPASNPFLHGYHPDHDNLQADFSTPAAKGDESYDITRQITLTFAPPTGDFDGVTLGGLSLSGDYAETITVTGHGTRTFDVRGSIVLKRISDITTLTTQ